MVGVVRAYGEVGSGLRDLLGGCCQNLGNSCPVVPTNGAHDRGHRHRVHCYLRVIMLTHEGRRLQTDCAITQGSALGTTGYDTYVSSHNLPILRRSTVFHLTTGISNAAVRQWLTTIFKQSLNPQCLRNRLSSRPSSEVLNLLLRLNQPGYVWVLWTGLSFEEDSYRLFVASILI